MLINSFSFLFCFMPLSLLIMWGMKRYVDNIAFRQAVFTVLSFLFYGLDGAPVLLGTIWLSYWFGGRIAAGKGRQRVRLLAAGIVICLLPLLYCKYLTFAGGILGWLIHQDVQLTPLIVPLGISFYTFSQIGYLADCFRGDAKQQPFLRYLTTVSNFFCITSGPIVDVKSLAPQFEFRKKQLKSEEICKALCLISFGLFKKVIIADYLSKSVNSLAAVPGDSMYMMEAWLFSVGYSLQLYFDFSGYSEMVMGIALLFGIELPRNFSAPYKSLSIIEFWRRWHMTLGYWVKNYLYIPMGGNRRGQFRKSLNLFLSMAIIGLWHGAGWNFVLWGCLHGLYLVINHQWRRFHITIPKAIAWMLTFVSVVHAWVFFRVSDIRQGWSIIQAMYGKNGFAVPESGLSAILQSMGVQVGDRFSSVGLPGLALVVVAFLIALILPDAVSMTDMIIRKPDRRSALMTALLFSAAVIIVGAGSATEFLYYQF